MTEHVEVWDAFASPFTPIEGPAIENCSEESSSRSPRPRGRHRLSTSSRLRSAGFRPFRTIAVTVTAAALATAAFAGVRAASAGETPAHQIAQQQLAGHVTGDIDVLASGRYEAVLAGPSGTTQTSPVTFSTEAAASSYLAQADDILKDASDSAPKITPGGHQSVQLDWSLNLPCGFTCGADSSGGDHYWVIASYQQIANVSVIAAFSAGCLAYLAPEIQGSGSTGVRHCGIPS